MDYLGIALGFIVLIVLCLLNIHTSIAAFGAALVVVIFAGLPFTESLVDIFFTRFGSVTAMLLPMFLFGAILAKLYTNSGAATVIAESISNGLFKFAKTQTAKYCLGFFSVIAASALMCYGGINAGVALIAVYPIAISIFERAGIPKRFIMGAICGGAFTFGLSGPGAPQPTNVVAMAIGTSSYCGLVAGICGIIAEIAVMLFVLTRMCIKATKGGETFVPGPKDIFVKDDQKRPNLFVSLIPLVILIITFNVFELNVAVAIMLSCVIAAVLFWPYLSIEKLKASLNDGAAASFIPAIAIGSVNGFAAVVQTVPGYQKMIDGLLGSKLPPVILLIVCIAVICMITGGSTTGLQIALPVLVPSLTKMGLPLAFIHRVGAFSATMLDSLPNSGSVIMAVNLADLKMKDGYPPMFISTVLATTCGTMVIAIIMTLFPMLP